LRTLFPLCNVNANNIGAKAARTAGAELCSRQAVSAEMPCATRVLPLVYTLYVPWGGGAVCNNRSQAIVEGNA